MREENYMSIACDSEKQLRFVVTWEDDRGIKGKGVIWAEDEEDARESFLIDNADRDMEIIAIYEG